MKNKIIALLTCGVVSLSVLAGCGSTNQEESSASQESSANQEASSSQESSEEEPAEPVVLTIWDNWIDYAQYYASMDEVPVYQAIQEATGIDLEFVSSIGGSEALSLLVATGDLPDIIVTVANTFPNGPATAVAEGTIVDFAELIDQGLMPNLAAILEERPEVRKLLSTDEGYIPLIPPINEYDPPVSSGLILRKDWLDDLGMDLPTTVQELEDVLVAFKEEKGSRGMGFAFTTDSRFVNTFGVNEGMYRGADGKVHYGQIEDGYREFLEVFSKWYNEGLIDPDAYSRDEDTFWNYLATGQNGALLGFAGSSFNQLSTFSDADEKMEFVPVPNIARVEGEGYLYDPSLYAASVGNGIFISGNCENLEAAAKLIDYNFSEEGTILMNYGIEGESYEIVDGEYRLTDFIKNNPDGLSPTVVGSYYFGWSGYHRIALLEAQKLIATPKAQEAWAAWSNNVEGVAKPLPTLTLSAEEAEEYSSIMADIDTYAQEYKLQVIMGLKSLDTWDDFVNDLKAMGIEKAIDIYQTAYDKFNAR